jgi:hypothetical protein
LEPCCTPDSSWNAAIKELAAARGDFMNGDATGLQALYSHRDDVTVMGGFGGFERGWVEVGPRLAWAASPLSWRRLQPTTSWWRNTSQANRPYPLLLSRRWPAAVNPADRADRQE